jgi:cbb3-type cytochrome oxidase cytochrome c subunit
MNPKYSKLFESMKESGNSKGVRGKVNQKLRSEGYTNKEIVTARALLNNSTECVADLDDEVVKYYNDNETETKDVLDAYLEMAGVKDKQVSYQSTDEELALHKILITQIKSHLNDLEIRQLLKMMTIIYDE